MAATNDLLPVMKETKQTWKFNETHGGSFLESVGLFICAIFFSLSRVIFWRFGFFFRFFGCFWMGAFNAQNMPSISQRVVRTDSLAKSVLRGFIQESPFP